MKWISPPSRTVRQYLSRNVRWVRRRLAFFFLGHGSGKLMNSRSISPGAKISSILATSISMKNTFFSSISGLLHGHHHGLPAALHGDEQHIRVNLGGLSGEFSLSAADLHPQRRAVRLQAPPVAPERLRLIDSVSGAFFHSGFQIPHFSHSHGVFLQASAFWSIIAERSLYVKGNIRFTFAK